MRVVRLLAMLAAAHGLLGKAVAARQNEAACGLVLDSIAIASLATRDPVEFQPDNRCFQLAGIVVIGLADPFYGTIDVGPLISPRDLQPTTSGSAAPAGTPAQGDAVPTAQPVTLAGGSVSAVGSDAGADAITSLTINPSIFFVSPGDREAAARYSRLTDMTVFFPVNGLDADGDGDVDYFGLRWRINITGVAAGRGIMDSAQVKLEELLRGEYTSIEQLEALLAEVDDPKACFEALLGKIDNADQKCDAEAIVSALGKSKYEEFRRDLAEIREKADSRYVGLDIRLDFGDPTLGAVADAEGTSIVAGLAFGRRFVSDDPDAAAAGVKGRLGVRYVDLKNVGETNFALDGGLALEARRPLGDTQTARVSGGFEFRWGNGGVNDAELQSDFLVFKASVAVPVAGATAVAISVAAPLLGDGVSPTLSVSFDWGLLLPQARALVGR